MAEIIPISFELNGRKISDQVDSDMTLLNYIRRNQGLTGTKLGCGKAHCGTCTVLINGIPTKSCVLKLKSSKLKDAVIETIEGLSQPDQPLHPIQESFARTGALQCGFCTPGMIMSVKGLLSINPSPTREDITTYLGPRNICRCTGYQKILDAVSLAAKAMRGESVAFESFPNDASVRYDEAILKTTGRLLYADDITWNGMIYGKVLFADRAPARVLSLDFSGVENEPDVIGTIAAADIPGSAKMGMVDRDQPVLVGINEIVRSVSDPVAAVFAESPETATRALSEIKIFYEDLPGVYTAQEALKPDAVKVWSDRENNIFYDGTLSRGEPDQAFTRENVTVSGSFSTTRIAHGFMEPECGLARSTDDGTIEIHYPTQTVFDDQVQLSEILAIPRDRIRVRQLPTGGAFGGKEDLVFQPILALAALKFKRPVKISLSREESLQASQKKHPMQFKARLAVGKDGMFQGLEADILADKGAYACLGFDIIENAMAFVGGPYYIPTVRINGKSVYTHNIMSGAMRGFGANQANYVIESLVDMAARELNMDPFEIRLMNALKTGLPTVTDHILEAGIAGVEDTLKAARAAFDKEATPEIEPGTRLGIGLACGVKNIGFGHGLPESAGAKIELKADGSCRLYVTHHEYGQGAKMGQARLASEILGIDINRIEVISPDTELTPYTGASTASRQTFLSGNATVGACRQLLSDLFETASKKMDILNPASLKIDGAYIRVRNSDTGIAIADLGETHTAEFRAFPPETDGFAGNTQTSDFNKPGFISRRTHWAYAYGVQIAWVQVNEQTGRVKVLKVVTASDVGKSLNPRAIEGQQEGGVVMGLGYALSEEFKVAEGKVLSKTLKQCGLPTADTAPEIVSLAIEIPHPWGPLGLKGLAEAPSLATAPAIANAIFDAVGVRLQDLPMTPERVLAALKDRN